LRENIFPKTAQKYYFCRKYKEMNLKTGDRVKFLNDIGGGVLTAFLNKNKAMVRTTDGFEIPVMINELIADKGDFESEKKPTPQPETPGKAEIKAPVKKTRESSEAKRLNTDEELCFAILPKSQGSDLFAYMINNSSYHIHYVITTHGDEETLLFDQGVMDSRTQMKIKKFLPDNINQIIRFDIQILFYQDDFFIPRDPVSLAVFMNPSEVYSGKALIENDYFDRKALVFSIINFKKKIGFSSGGGMDVSKMLNDKISNDKPAPIVREEKKSKNEPEEVDLHIEEIVESITGMSNSEIIDLQMARFKISLDTAILHKTKRIVFIHGVGNGKLKFTLRKALDEKYPDLQYQDASFKEYGYGATMVIIP
jgi:hypothetical protein